MREIRLHGSEGGGAETNRSFLPLSSRKASLVGVISWLDIQARQQLLANPIAIAYYHSRCPAVVKRPFQANSRDSRMWLEAADRLPRLEAGDLRGHRR